MEFIMKSKKKKIKINEKKDLQGLDIFENAAIIGPIIKRYM